ncbi:MAG: cobalamin biosynthesis protein [Eubacteriales bacterium]|nr:cobalamin biosynthesis protein [Lachnospiraceae bacterium]MDO5127986.1 cobalamin biosynthesis protein [Eubacteriales bacterium]
MTEIVKAYIPKAKAIIFFTATGIAVRTMASFLKHKSVDPAVLAVDEMGKYCISVLSGHVGGANVLAQFVSGLTGATPVVTTATDLHDKFSVDSFAKKNGLVMTDWTLAKEVSAAVLRGEKIGIDTDCEIQSKLPDELVLIKHETNRAEGSETRAQDPNYEVRITADMLRIYRKNEQTLVLVPKCYVVGVGCKSNTPESAIYDAVKVCMDMYGADMRGLAAVASIDGKAEEPGLVAFCKNNELPFMTYDAQTLNEIEGDYSKSQFVMDVMGVDNVCERSAMACAKTFERVDASYGQAEFICRKTAMNGVTVSIVRMERKISL